MNIKPVYIILLLGLTLMVTGSAAAQATQSHPLSQIFPIDEDLNMQGYEVRNMSQITLDEGSEPEGLLLDDLTITHEGRVNKLSLDYQNNEWRIENTDLDLNGNNISGFFGSACPAGQFMVDMRNNGNLGCVSATQEVQDEYVNRAGDSMEGTLDMAGNGILGVKHLETSGNGVFITDSSGTYNLTRISEAGDFIIPRGGLDLRSGDLDGVRNLRLVGSSDNNQYTLVYDETNSRLALSNSGEDVLRIDDSTNNLILPSGGLDMRSSNINNFFGSACAEGDLMVQVNSDGSFSCVDATGEVEGDFVSRSGDSMTGSLDMRGNDILVPGEVDGVNLTNPGNAIIVNGNRYSIPTDAIQSDELDQTDSYSLGWSNLNGISQTDITVADLGAADANLDMNGNNVNNVNSINNYYSSSCPTGEVMVDIEDNGNLGCVNVTSEVQDTYVNRAGDTMQGTLDMNSNTLTDTTGTLTLGGGNIEITTGNLDMNSGNLNSVNTVNSGGTTLNTGGDIVSGGTVESSTDLRTGSGTVTSSSTMCIGDQC